LAKYNLLSALEPAQVWRWLIVAHTAARWTTLPLCLGLPYARAEGHGKLVARQVSYRAAAIGTLTLLAALTLLPWRAAAVALAVVIVIVVASGWYYNYRIQGITGDCLGATNQVAEVALYLVAVMLS